MTKKLVWDVPTRLFHWLLVFSIVGQWVTAELLDDAMQIHFYLGYFTLGLIVFRLIWGIVGTRYAKFSQFVTSPTTVAAYGKTLADKNSASHTGHNPLGGYAVVAMLLLIAIQGVSGLFIWDEVFLEGPYYSAVSEATVDVMNTLHHKVFTAIKIIVGVHIAAIVFYAVYKKQKLVPAMVHGKKDTKAPGIDNSQLLLALVIALMSALIIYLGVDVLAPEPEWDEY